MQKMKSAAAFGGKFSQGSMFLLLVAYCLRGRSIGLKFGYGILYGYWLPHFYTLGSYLGVMLQLPSITSIIQRPVESPITTIYSIQTNRIK
jgi:hypothetical protein